jgi:uncharacterized membrane protein YccC
MLKFAGFSPSAWAFALRTWAAMMLALYAAFWLQLASASSAAVTVGILALSTRGQTYQKAMYRILMTAVGVVASIVIAGLLAQARDLFVIAYATWLGICVYVCGFLDGNRAYGVVLSGYTVANRFTTEHFLERCRTGSGDHSRNCRARAGQRCVSCSESSYDPFG